MSTLFHLGGLPVTSYGVNIALAMAIVWAGTCGYAAEKGAPSTLWIPLGLWMVPLTWGMARLVYVLANITYYTTTLSNPWLAFRFWDGGYSAVGAAAGVLLSAWGFAKANRLSVGEWMDGAGMSMLLGVALIRAAEAGTDLGLGKAVGAAWMRQIPFFSVEDGTGEMVHAVFLYEVVAAIMISLVVLWWLSEKRKKHLHPGDIAMMVVTLLSLTQIFMESLRDDGHMVVHFVRISQVVCMVAAIWVLAALGKRHPKHYALRWVIFLLGLGNVVYQEFLIDSSEHPALNYAFMVLSLCAMGWTILSCIGCHCDHPAVPGGKKA